jgi:hypothetical protein
MQCCHAVDYCLRRLQPPNNVITLVFKALLHVWLLVLLNADTVTYCYYIATHHIACAYTDHVGRTVVIDHCGIPGNVWIEGESDGTCPIREREATAEQVGFIEVTVTL